MTKKITLLVVSEPGKGGVKRHVVELLEKLDLSRFSVTYAYSKIRSDAQYENDVYRLSNYGIVCRHIIMYGQVRLWSDLIALVKILWRIFILRPDIVHLHSSKAGFLGRLASALLARDCIAVYTPHQMACDRSIVYWGLEKMMGMYTDAIIAVSKSEEEQIRKWRVCSRKTNLRTITLSGCKKSWIETNRNIFEKTGKKLTIATCGRICYAKNPLLFFSVAASLMRKRCDLEFVWIGDYDNDESALEVRRLRERDPLAMRVNITGWVSNANDYIRECDIFCMVSRGESFCYVVADAMEMGKPVVCVRAMGLVDLVVHKETGLLCDPDEIGLEAAIDQVAGDHRMREALGQRAKAWVAANLSLEKTVLKNVEVYEQCFGDRGEMRHL